jgi:hypothetical protein
MLSMQKVLYYIKRQLGFPYVGIELSDNDIEMEIKMFVLPKFSKYVPNINWVPVNPNNPQHLVTPGSNMYYIFDPDGCSILNVVAVHYEETDYLVHRYPYTYTLANEEEVIAYVEGIERAETAMIFSGAARTFMYIPPNIIRVYPHREPPASFIVKYERVHPEHLATIPAEFEIDFLVLSLAHIMTICGNIRNKYQTITTPFGDIPLNADLRERAETLEQNVISRLENLPPNILIDVY